MGCSKQIFSYFNFVRTNTTRGADLFSQFWHFIVHLRLHYHLFILSGGFLLGGFLSTELDAYGFIIQFVNIHFFLFGGATAYNSYWDRDEGPVGGLKNPPEIVPWMWGASLLLQGVGLMLAMGENLLFVILYLASILLFWLYSTPLARWKGHPIKSLLAIGISTGFNSVLLGYLAAGNRTVSTEVIIAAVGVMFILLSLYPASQVYQQEEDSLRGDQTFAIRYGISGVSRFFKIAFFTGLFLVAVGIAFHHMVLGAFFGGIGAVTGLLVYREVKQLVGRKEGYSHIMKIKYRTSMAFVVFLLAVLIIKHLGISGISSVVDLLLK